MGAKVSFTRPNNATPYGAGDVVGAAAAALEFPIGREGGGDVTINSAVLRIDVSSVPAGQTSYTLHMYDVTPPSALADNAPWDLPAGDRASYLGSISLGTPADVGSSLVVSTNAINRVVTSLGRKIFAYLVTDAGFTPGAQAVYTITLNTQRRPF
jgi:hypothetical protein